MTSSRIALRVAAALIVAASAAHGTATLEGEAFAADVRAAGVLAAVPEDGLTTVDGPRVELYDGFAEWAGLTFREEGGAPVAFCAGAGADWAGRAPMLPVSFVAGTDHAVSVVRAGPLEVTTTFRFSTDGPYLLAGVRVANRGARTARDVVISREWAGPAVAGFTFPDEIPAPPAPPGIARRLIMLDDLPPGASGGVGFSYARVGHADPPVPDGGVEVPLQLWTHPDFPEGLEFGDTNGISWGDYDADGWPDVFACDAGWLWRNREGLTWELVAEFNETLLPFTIRRYGSSFGDYDNDGDPDIAIEPRNVNGDSCFHLLRNEGGVGANFLDVAVFPQILDVQPCDADSETACWGDVDVDGDLDLFLPVYPPWAFEGPGNFFFENLGPLSPGGPYAFTETSAQAGLDNPPDSARPEGAMFADADGDGDMDLYSNGTLYVNVSSEGVPDFDALSETESGIGYSQSLEEGSAFFDYDRDGDFDLITSYFDQSLGITLWENRGDGTFFEVEEEVIENADMGLGLGVSIADWDNDGDLDVTTRQLFRRNQLVETGQRLFTNASNDVPIEDSFTATPAWADWDRDGDLDCALGNWQQTGHFYENTLYDAETPDADRRYVRVRVMDDPEGAPDGGLETAYGASVEVVVDGDPPGLRRRRLVASSAGYLNQNEYALHFALPDDPLPADPDTDVRFDVIVDFPSLPEQGSRRVGPAVNRALAAIDLADLVDREIVVFRSGRARIDGVDELPDAKVATPVLLTTGSGLATPGAGAPLPAPTAVAGAPRLVGIEFATATNVRPRLTEILLDGQLADPASCGPSAFNLVLWDVTASGAPEPVAGWARETSPRNDRTALAVDAALEPARVYRLVARVTSFRSTAVAAPVDQTWTVLHGGLSYAGPSPCAAGPAGEATVDPQRVYLAARLVVESDGPWLNLGQGKAGPGGEAPLLVGEGTMLPGTRNLLVVSGAPPESAGKIVMGVSTLEVPLLGGTLVPAPDLQFGGVDTDPAGETTVSFVWPPDGPAGVPFFIQAWLPDPGDPDGYVATNAVRVSAP